MKKLKLLLLTVLCTMLFTSKVSAKDKVKVYIFEAGGCPYCEAEINYLEGLDTYNKEFEIVRKELYVDHVDWEKGKDYDLGVKVADAFNEKGYEDASYQGTPFVVIGNIYAAASYNENLEDTISKAYKNQSPDVVGCFEKGKDNCSDKIKESDGNNGSGNNGSGNNGTTEDKKDDSAIGTLVLTIIICAGVVVLLVKTRNSNK